MNHQRITLAEFIGKLQAYPNDATIRLEDADTGWSINNIHIDYDAQEKIITLAGVYSEMS